MQRGRTAESDEGEVSNVDIRCASPWASGALMPSGALIDSLAQTFALLQRTPLSITVSLYIEHAFQARYMKSMKIKV